MSTFPAGRRLALSWRRRRLCALAAALALVAASAAGGSGAPGSLRSRTSASAFRPASVTFISPSTGWVLGIAPCAAARSCLALRQTTDAGRSWTSRPLPAALVAAAGDQVGGADPIARLDVRFADPRDGWIYGGTVDKRAQGDPVAPALWSTHDGGLRWRRLRLSGVEGSLFDLEAGNGTAHLLAPNTNAGVTVESSPVAEDRWHHSSTVRLGDPAGGGEMSGAIVLEGANGWLVEGNDRGTTGSARLARNGRWVSWTPPCASVGGSFAVPAASSAADLLAVCVMGGFASPLSRSAPRGATVESSWLYRSSDGGRVFRAGPELARRPSVFFGVLASPRTGVIVLGASGPSGNELRASFDGGRDWTVVYRGQLSFLGFTTPVQGVGIVSSRNSTCMIMSFDSGHSWRRVTF